ncbi:MAG: hypothetical protein AAB536_00350 [Patescibacteria group bacterium]
MERFSIEWQAPEFEYRDKHVSWYWLSVMIAIVLLSVSILQKNFLFAVFIVIAEILVMVWANRKPRTILFKLDEKGLTVDGGKFYPYSEIEAFCVRENEPDEWSEVAFRLRRGIRPWLKTITPAKRLPEIEKALKPIVGKTEFEESFIDSIERLIGF